MPALSNYLTNKLIDVLFRTGTYSAPSTLYVALCTTTPTAASTGSTITEPSGNYERKGVPTGSLYWYSTQGTTASISTGTTGMTGNVTAVTWTTASWTGTLTSVALLDSYTVGQGNMLWYANLSATKTITSGDNLQFDVNTFKPSLS